MPRYFGKFEKTKAIPNVLVPRHRQSKWIWHFSFLDILLKLYSEHLFDHFFDNYFLKKFLFFVLIEKPNYSRQKLNCCVFLLAQQVKKKMLYSSSFDALKKSLVGVQKYIQATDLSEASQEAVEEKLRATDRQ